MDGVDRSLLRAHKRMFSLRVPCRCRPGCKLPWRVCRSQRAEERCLDLSLPVEEEEEPVAAAKTRWVLPIRGTCPSRLARVGRRPRRMGQQTQAGLIRESSLDQTSSDCSFCIHDVLLIARRPDCFNRPPAKADSFFRYDDFEAFSLHAKSLNRAWELYLPRALVSHDVSEADW